jgi:type IV pilus assembly protein PilM
MGVDIGSSAVKIVQLRKSRDGWMVTSASIVDIAKTDDDSEGLRDANSLKAILSCIGLARAGTNLAVCGVGGPGVAVLNFEFPSLRYADIEKAVLFEARQLCPFNTDDIAIEYRLIPDGHDKIKGFFVAATHELVISKVQLAKEAGLNCVLMDVDGFALLNCLNEVEKAGVVQKSAVLDVGSSYTTLAIEGTSNRPFIRTLTYAGDSIAQQIADEHGVSTGAVKAMLSGDSQAVLPNFDQSLKQACSGLIEDIDKTVQYCGAQERASEVKKLFVCGGFALARGFVELLNSELPMEAVLWNPFEKMRCHITGNHRAVLLKKILHKSGPAMAVAAGLAMRSI